MENLTYEILTVINHHKRWIDFYEDENMKYAGYRILVEKIEEICNEKSELELHDAQIEFDKNLQKLKNL